MKRLAIVSLVLGACAASTSTYAMEMTQGARLGAALGRYGNEDRIRGFDQTGNPTTPELGLTTVELTYGGELGYTLTFGDFYSDIGLNVLRTKAGDEKFWRTDGLFTLGYYITDNWSVFAGVRRGWQGDGVFNSKKFWEFGPYVGFGYGGIPLGGWGTMNTSFAYNFDRVEGFFRDIPNTPPGFDYYYPGISVKLGMNVKGTPHSLQLRLQRFGRGNTVPVQDSGGNNIGRIDFNFTETWAVLSYVFTLAW
jgi:hypothetical protein